MNNPELTAILDEVSAGRMSTGQRRSQGRPCAPWPRRPLAQGGRMSPTPTLIRQVAANGGISISVNGIARPLDEANCRLTRELVGRIGESDDPELASFAQLVDTLRSSALSALGPFELENAAWCASVLGAES